MNNEVLEQLKQEYNETLKRAQDLGEIIANCVDLDNTHHCGLDAEKPRETIAFDGSENERTTEKGASLQDIMAQIRKDTDDFMNYLEAIVKTQE